MHGFIDGYSRLITGLRASNNNLAATVLDVFLEATAAYGIPSRLRGDHGVENLQVAAWMDMVRGAMRGSYIWGRSVICTLLFAECDDQKCVTEVSTIFASSASGLILLPS